MDNTYSLGGFIKNQGERKKLKKFAKSKTKRKRTLLNGGYLQNVNQKFCSVQKILIGWPGETVLSQTSDIGKKTVG